MGEPRSHCWYRCDKRCQTQEACRIAGRCCEMWNAAECRAVRDGMGGPLWMHHEPPRS